jgi:Glycosyltransferases involved in cell wall biogenesis
MATPAQLHTYSENYAFQFDAPFPLRVYERSVLISGWLLERYAKPIHGLRALVRRSFLGRKTYRARRKRARPDVATAFPHLPEAGASGFLFELCLSAGVNQITFQVQDERRAWRTFHTVKIAATPLDFLDSIGLRHFRSVLVRLLRHSSTNRKRPLAVPKQTQASVSSRIKSRIESVDLLTTSKSNLFIREIGDLIAAGFSEIGCRTRILVDQLPAQNEPPETLQIVITPHEYYNLFLTQRVGFEKAQQLTREVALLCTEQPETEWFQSNLWWTSQARVVADISPLGTAAYRARGIRSYCLPLGYHPILGTGGLVQSERPYDITFLGSMTHRRDAFFAEHAPFFSDHRCHLRLVPLGFAKTSQTRSYLSVEKRTELLSESKILLNIHYSEQKYFEWHRSLVSIANGCCVISEICEGHGALVPGKHFVMVEQDQLIAACEYYLNHPAERSQIADDAFAFVKNRHSQAKHCRVFLEQYESGGDFERSRHETIHIDSDLPIDSEPARSPVLLRRGLAQNARQALSRALVRDLRRIARAFVARPATKEIKRSQTAIITAAEVETRRREFKRRWQEQENAARLDQAVLERHENNAYRSETPPILSVVITLHNYGHFIGECLTSVERAIEQIHTPAEIVVVNDASTDDSLRQALTRLETSARAMLVADKKWNTGLADARNKAVHLARGKYIFMMDADNLLWPRGLKELLDLLQNSDYAAAYSMICRFRDSVENRLGLLSYFDWDPQILAQYPYIDAMAMFRRDTLLELAGYDNQLSQIGWFGWEDYDLWLRFAIKGYKVGFVPNILSLYRIHETSMINTTARYEVELVQHLIQNYGSLLDRFEPQPRVFGVDREKVFPPASPMRHSAAETVESGIR